MNKNKEIISSFFRKVKPSLFKVRKHPVRKSTNYEKEVYITMLYTLAGSDGDICEAENHFIQRIIKGIRLDGQSSEYMKRASNIDEKTLSEFLNSFSGSRLAHNFFVDSMVLLNLSESVSDDSIEMLSEYAEVLKIDPQTVESLTHLSEIIIEKDEVKYHEWLKSKSEKIKLKNLFYYIKEFATGRIINDASYEYWYGSLEINESEVIERKKIKIKDAVVTLSKDVKIEFQSCDKVEIDDSDFKGYHGLHIENTRKVEIEDSTFEGFKSRALYLKSIVKLEIEDSKFIDCSYTSSESSAYGGVIYMSDIEKIEIEESTFKDCSVNGDPQNGLAGAAIYAKDTSVQSQFKFKENVFVNCNCYYDSGELYEEASTLKGSVFEKHRDRILKKNKFQGCKQEIS